MDFNVNFYIMLTKLKFIVRLFYFAQINDMLLR